MEQLNRIELRGNVGSVRLPQKDGAQVVNFSMATNYVYMSRGGEPQMDTTWHNVVAWNVKGVPDLASISVGVPVHVIGRLRSTRYTGSDGVDRYYCEVVASSVEILDEQLTVQAGF